MKSTLHPFFITLALLAGLAKPAPAAVSFAVTPTAVSNSYRGAITLRVAGLTAGDTVVVQKFLDANANGIIDAGDLLVQQFNLTDGRAGMVIGGITNFNVPGDTDPIAGQITAPFNFSNGDFAQGLVGKYLFKLSSSGGHFTPLIKNFDVTNFPWAQQITGTVVSNGAAVTVPNAVVLLFPAPRAGNHGPGSPVAGTVADNSGRYGIQVPPGTYVPLAFQSNYVADYLASPVLTVGGGGSIATNLTITGATAGISGQMVDAQDPSIGLPGVLAPASTSAGLISVTFTDTNGNFTARVTPGQWNLGGDDSGLLVHGYVGYQNGANFAAGATNVIEPFHQATALAYGSVTNSQGQPLAGIAVKANDNNNGQYQSDAETDANGYFVLPILGGLGANDPWAVGVGNGDSPTNYIYSQPPFDQSGGTNISLGLAVPIGFTAVPAINRITGSVRESGINIVGVNVFASSTDANGLTYNVSADTDADGNYSMNVGNGIWSVGVNCYGGNNNDSLDDILGSGAYQCPGEQNVTNNNDNVTANFTVQTCNGIQISTPSPLPEAQVGDFYSFQLQASGCFNTINWSVNDPADFPSTLNLQLAADGTLSGTPTGGGAFNFSVHVDDGNGHTADTNLSLTIAPAVVSNPMLGSPTRLPGQFQMQLTGAANQNYSVQMSTNLNFTDWITLFSTNNPTANSFLLTDPHATNQQRFYRILVGP